MKELGPSASEARKRGGCRGETPRTPPAAGEVAHGRSQLTIRFACRYDAALLADNLLDDDEKKRDECEDHLGLHTPTMKAFLTELGQECTSLGMQIYGGAGFIKDYGTCNRSP
jgi:alkylation response protein AidB-like acyl-CoA dehydrogenase